MSDLWQRIVGVPIDAWVAADTPEKLTQLLYQRDHPQRCTVEHHHDATIHDFDGICIRTVRREPCNGYHDAP